MGVQPALTGKSIGLACFRDEIFATSVDGMAGPNSTSTGQPWLIWWWITRVHTLWLNAARHCPCLLDRI